MNKHNAVNILLVVSVIALVAGVAAMKSSNREEVPLAKQALVTSAPAPEPATVSNIPAGYSTGPAPVVQRLPRLVEIGGEKCIPCMQMAPIIEALQKEYAGRMDIEKIDVAKVPSAMNLYAVRLIPTQVFLKADGQEFWRHEGPLTKEEIVAKFVKMGIQ
jgi:thioredoxin 1